MTAATLALTVAQKPLDAAIPPFTCEVTASHLVSPSRLKVTRQSYILEVSHIHLCYWRCSLFIVQHANHSATEPPHFTECK